MPENNQILSVEGQLVGMPLAGPESFSPQQLDYLKRALGVDETVLYEGVDGSYTSGFTLSEPLSHFERIRFYVYCRESKATPDSATVRVVEISTLGTIGNGLNFGLVDQYFNNTWCLAWCLSWSTSNNLTYTLATSRYIGAQNNAYVNPGTNLNVPHVCKVVGIHRISGGN